MGPLDGNFNDELKKKINECDVVCCALRGPFKEAKRINNNSHFIHEGFDPLVYYPIINLKYKYDVSFIGNLKGNRNDYHKLIEFHLIHNAYGVDHARKIAQSKIILNVIINNSGISDRTYKILAASGFVLSESWKGIDNDFNVGENLGIFRSQNESKQKIKHYLINDSK